MIAAITVIYVALFVASAAADILRLRIPNAFVVALVGLFVVACFFHPPQSGLWAHVVPSAIAFGLAATLFFFDKLGGGDVKLLSAAVLWVGLGSLGPFLIALALYGAAAILVFAVFRLQVVAALAWTGDRLGRAIPTPASLQTGTSIPYGVVIAAAAVTIGPGPMGGAA